MVSYIDLPFGEWRQNYGDFIFDARGREFWIHLAAQLRCFYGFLGFLGGEKEKNRAG
jgi:hypothetical protein